MAGLYLGKQTDPKSHALGARVELDPADLVTHGLIVGMTGSGKTGLAVVLIEELLRQGVPVIALDPKGDLGNLLLLFDDLSPASFAPWIDPEAARRQGKSRDAAAEETAAAWKKGLGEWGLSGSDVAALRAGHAATIYTPGSSAGVSLNVLRSLDAPAGSFDDSEEDLRDEISAIVGGLLGLVGIDADPLESREYVFLSNLIESRWRAGEGLSLETLIARVQSPPFDKVGALPLESVYPGRDRQRLLMALNNLLALPSFEAWREGEPFEIEGMLRTPDGRPRLSIVYTAHLPDEQRLFVTALLLDKVKTWMRRQAGTTQLRALVYLDEVFGYFPPHPRDPPTKRPLMTLLKQARAQGVGVVLATQNPVDIDYKGLANIGTWMIGTLQTDQDEARLRDGLLGAGADRAAAFALLDATRKRVFLLHDVHRSAPCLLHSRWALSYLRGPITRDEVSRLMKELRPAAAAPSKAATAASGPPPIGAPFRHNYYDRYGGELADPHLLVKYAVRYKGGEEVVAMRAYPLAAPSAPELLEAEPLPLEESAVRDEAPAALRYADVPGHVAPAGARAIERVLRERLADKLAVTLLFDPYTKSLSRPGEDRVAFAARLQAAGGGAREQKLREQLEKKKRDLAIKEQEAAGRTTEKWAAAASAGVSVLGALFGGGKRASRLGRALGTASRAGSVLSKDRMENAAEARVEALRAEVERIEAELVSLAAVAPGRFEEKRVVPSRADVKILRYDLLWVY